MLGTKVWFDKLTTNGVSEYENIFGQGAAERCSAPTPRHQEGRSCKRIIGSGKIGRPGVFRGRAQACDRSSMLLCAAYTPPLDIERTERDRHDVLRILRILLPEQAIDDTQKAVRLPHAAPASHHGEHGAPPWCWLLSETLMSCFYALNSHKLHPATKSLQCHK